MEVSNFAFSIHIQAGTSAICFQRTFRISEILLSMKDTLLHLPNFSKEGAQEVFNKF